MLPSAEKAECCRELKEAECCRELEEAESAKVIRTRTLRHQTLPSYSHLPGLLPQLELSLTSPVESTCRRLHQPERDELSISLCTCLFPCARSSRSTSLLEPHLYSTKQAHLHLTSRQSRDLTPTLRLPMDSHGSLSKDGFKKPFNPRVKGWQKS